MSNEQKKPSQSEDEKMREHLYTLRRLEAIRAADKAKEKARTSMEYCAARIKEIEYLQMEAKAEVFGGDVARFKVLQDLASENVRKILHKMGFMPQDLEPRYRCQRCNDTGFLSNGIFCDCI